jgi:hypothetical protein
LAVTIDNSPAMSFETNNPAGSVVSGVVTYAGTNYDTISSVVSTELYTNGGYYGAVTGGTSYVFSNIDTTVMNTNILVLMIVTSNASGLTNAYIFTNSVNNTPGSVSITAPAFNSLLTGVFTFSGTWIKGSTGYTGILLSNSLGTFPIPTNSGTWSTNINSGDFPDGTNVFSVLYIDGVNATNEVDTIQYIVDNSSPVSSLSGITNNQILKNVFSVYGTVTENYSSIAGVNLYITNVLGAVLHNWSQTLSGDCYTNTTNSQVLTDGGPYYMYLRSVNSVGITNNSSAVTFYVNNSPPVIQAITASNTNNNAYYDSELILSVSYTNAHPFFGIPSLGIKTNSTLILQTNTSSYSADIMLNISGFAEGSHTITIDVLDNGNFTTNTTNITIIIDRSAPSATIIYTGLTPGVPSSYDFQGTVSDPLSGIASAYLYFSNIDTGALSYITSSINGPTFTISVNTSSISDGNYTAVLFVTNNASLSVAVQTVVFEVKEILFKPVAGPNPCYADMNENVILQGVPAGTTVTIFTITEDKVRELHIEGHTGTALWDLKNEYGNEVAAGIYLIHIVNVDGNDRWVKIIVIR